MTEQEAFLHAILDAPDDDGLRLIYADWLEEHGDSPRAEFIRVQVGLARLPNNDPNAAVLYTRQNHLLPRFEKAWLGELHSFLSGWFFRRGFVESARIGVKKLLAHADTLFRREPVQELAVRGGRHLMHEVASSPHLARLTVLSFNNSYLDDAAAGILAASPFLKGLVHLSLQGNQIGDRGVLALLASPYLQGLKMLNLRGSRVSAELRQQYEVRFGHYWGAPGSG
ncbi:MAG TPA: TIGR02996 domain-containing protein [Gemmataceae bacterium]|jgi:uncharacterized protein (TIGR02996 family)